MSAGRPTDYSQDILDSANHYLESGYLDQEEAVPTVEGLACYIKKARSTIYDWASQEDKKEFSDIVEQLLSTQSRMLLTGGLKGSFNASITKLALTKHGYTDKQDMTTGGEKITPNEWHIHPVKRGGDDAS